MKQFLAKSPKEWRNWLEENHAKEKEIWLVYYKKHTGIPSISYLESVEVALCFGWIDGTKKRIDDEKYTHRFTLRRARSHWSSRNITIAQRMIEENKKYFERVLNESKHNSAIENGETSLSYKATMSALLINLYRDEPILHSPYRLLKNLVEFDHQIAT